MKFEYSAFTMWKCPKGCNIIGTINGGKCPICKAQEIEVRIEKPSGLDIRKLVFPENIEIESE